jgi:hypothetical protein
MSETNAPIARNPMPQQPSVVRSPNFRDAYVNALRIRISPIDFVITLGKTLDVPGANAVQDEVSISMPLPFAKILLLHLTQAIEATESVLGDIKVPVANLPRDDLVKNIIENLKNTPLTSGR